MSKAAIAASLVNMRNVGTHKSVALTIHVPEEQAQAVIDAFGWPTAAQPVPVAIARLQEGEGPPGRPVPGKLSPAVRDAAIVCREPEFWRYLEKVRSCPCDSEKEAATYVRAWCGVKSRADITPGSLAERAWSRLFLDYCSKREKAHG